MRYAIRIALNIITAYKRLPRWFINKLRLGNQITLFWLNWIVNWTSLPDNEVSDKFFENYFLIIWRVMKRSININSTAKPLRKSIWNSKLKECSSSSYRIDWSTTDWHPLNDRYFKNPPHLCEIFSITGPWMSSKQITVNQKLMNSHYFTTQHIPQRLVENRINLFFANLNRLMPKYSSICSPVMCFAWIDIMIAHGGTRCRW